MAASPPSSASTAVLVKVAPRLAKNRRALVRDYRNYIHPQKELSHGITLEPGDAHMLFRLRGFLVRVPIGKSPKPPGG